MPLGVWDAASIAVKALTYAATLGAAGAVLFLGYCGGLVASADGRKIRRVVLVLSVLAVFASAAQILVSAGSMSGEAAGMLDGSLLRMTWQAGAGRADVIRAVGLLIVVCGVLSPRILWLAFVGAAMAATSFAWLGHARSLDPHLLPIVLLGVHLLAVAFWLGALPPLLIVVRSGNLPTIAATAARFGVAAVVVVCGLVAAGLGLLWMMLGDITELWRSTYGRYVTVKLCFVVCILCLAAYNKLRLTPRLLAHDAAAARSLRISVRAELLLGVLILVVTATFTTAAGPPVLD
jgi:copper resistance protein D